MRCASPPTWQPTEEGDDYNNYYYYYECGGYLQNFGDLTAFHRG